MTESTQAEGKTKPVWKDRMGAVGVAVWENEGEKGTFYNATFERTYKDSKDEWQESGSFGREDLALVAKLADRAQDFIYAQSKKKDEETDA